MARVLVLRPEPGATTTIERARAMGLDAVATPLFAVGPLDWAVPEASAFDGLLLTSANAVRHGGDGLQALRGLKAYAVGEATAQAARDAGFHVAATGDAGVARLLATIESDLRLLHLCGVDRRPTDGARQSVTPIPVYRSELVDDVHIADANLALIHSPRTAARFAELVEDKSSIIIAAISQAVADAAGDGWRAVEIAEQPSDEALVALASRLCNKLRP